MARAIFLDRDGTIIEEKGYLNTPEQIRFKKGVIEGLKLLQEYGFYLFIVTNQSGVKRGWVSRKRVERINRTLIRLLKSQKVFIKDIEVCYHHPKERCGCRKPAPFMIYRLLFKYPEVAISESFVIGDKDSDVQLALNTGAKGIKVYRHTDFLKVAMSIVKGAGTPFDFHIT